MAEIMKEICEADPKNLRKNFRVKNLLCTKCFSLFPGVEKVQSTMKPDNFMQLFWTFTGVPVCPKCFLYEPGT